MEPITAHAPQNVGSVVKNLSTKTDKARELALQGFKRSEIMEQVPCARTTAFNAIKWAQAQKARGKPKAPEVKVEEKPIAERFKPEAPIEEEAPVEEEEVPEEKPEVPMEFRIEDVETFFDAIFGKDTWGEYGMDKGKTHSMARLWRPVFIKHWEQIVETWGVEIMAVIGTIFIVGGHIRKVRGRKKKAVKREGEEKAS